MKKFTLLVALTFVFVFSAAAQTDNLPKAINGGVLNGKAKNLVKPAYPAAARAVNAEGAVSIQVVIDEEGNVSSATAVSGHPLLRQAAEGAALESKFSPTMLSGQPVKVTGTVVYNFVADKSSNWFKSGYDLASLERVPTLTFFNTGAIAKNIKSDWTAETEQLNRLEAMKKAEITSLNETIITNERKVSETAEKNASGTVVRKVITEQSVKSPNPPNAEQVAIAQNLISSLQGRLANDEKANWQFVLGVTLSRAMANVRNQSELQSSISALRQQIASAPAGIAPDYTETVQKIIELLEVPNPTAEQRSQIGQLMPRLFRD
ncbi:MAG TPA: energy transducer TonB [Pyrinomonadaceae bacterium]|jgi:TonB family protein